MLKPVILLSPGGGEGGGRNLGDHMVFRAGTEGDQSSPTEYKGETGRSLEYNRDLWKIR